MLDEGGNREEDEKGGGLTPWTAASLLVLDSETRTGTRRKVAGCNVLQAVIDK